jgi:hypothetical protein
MRRATLNDCLILVGLAVFVGALAIANPWLALSAAGALGALVAYVMG